MDLTIESKDYRFAINNNQQVGYFLLFFYTEWGYLILYNAKILVDKKTIKKMIENCNKDKYNYFKNNIDLKEIILDKLNAMFLVMSKNEKVHFKFY